MLTVWVGPFANLQVRDHLLIKDLYTRWLRISLGVKQLIFAYYSACSPSVHTRLTSFKWYIAAIDTVQQITFYQAPQGYVNYNPFWPLRGFEHLLVKQGGRASAPGTAWQLPGTGDQTAPGIPWGWESDFTATNRQTSTFSHHSRQHKFGQPM